MFAESVALLRARIGTALRLGWPLLGVQIAILAYEAPRTPGYFTPIFWPGTTDAAADVPDWFWAVSLGAPILGSAWVAAMWFRCILGGAPAQFAVPLRPLALVLWHSAVVAMCSLAVAAPILMLALVDVNLAGDLDGLIRGDDAETAPVWRAPVQTIVYQILTFWALYVVSLSLGLVVVAKALGERLSYIQAVYVLEGAWGRVVRVAGVLSLIYVLSLGPAVLNLGLWASIAWTVALDFLSLVLTFAALAVLYARQIEGRALV